MCNSEALTELTDQHSEFNFSPTTHTPIEYNNNTLLNKCFQAGLYKAVRKDLHINMFTNFFDSINEENEEHGEDEGDDKKKKEEKKKRDEKRRKEDEKKRKMELLQRCFLVGAHKCEQRKTGKDALLGKCLAAGLFKRDLR